MAKDIKLVYNPETYEYDLELNAGDLTRDETFDTAVLVSMFSDRRADEGEYEDDPRGWWADQVNEDEELQFGSKLWLLERSTPKDVNLRKAEQYAVESLDWMIQDEAAADIEVTAYRQGDAWNSILGLEVKIKKLDTDITVLTYDDIWRLYYAI